MKICSKCGENKPKIEFHKNGKWLQSLCKPCQYKTKDEHSRNRKLQCINYAGGKCKDCGREHFLPAVYNFHHINPTKKIFSLNKAGSISWEKTKKELDNCDLLCANCHITRQAQERQASL
jgi:hypothetical protein